MRTEIAGVFAGAIPEITYLNPISIENKVKAP